MAGACEHGNELSGSTKCSGFFWLSKRMSASQKRTLPHAVN